MEFSEQINDDTHEAFSLIIGVGLNMALSRVKEYVLL